MPSEQFQQIQALEAWCASQDIPHNGWGVLFACAAGQQLHKIAKDYPSDPGYTKAGLSLLYSFMHLHATTGGQ